MATVPPPLARASSTAPPCASATWRTIASPRPDPGMPRAERRAIEAVEHVRQVLVGDPGAVVAHDDRPVRAPPARRRRRAGSTSRRCRADSRPRARCVAGTPRTNVSSRSVVNVTPARLRRARSTASAATQVEADVLGLDAVLLAARELDEVPDEDGHLVELLDDVGEQALALLGRQRAFACEHLDVRAQAGERRPQLVRGVRDELPLRARASRSSAPSIVLKLPARRLSSSSPSRVDPLGRGRRVAATCSVAAGQPADGRERGAGDEQAEPGRDGDAAARRSGSGPADARERVVDLRERPGDLDAPRARPERGSVSTRSVDAADVRVSVKYGAAVPSATSARRVVDGQLHGRRRAARISRPSAARPGRSPSAAEPAARSKLERPARPRPERRAAERCQRSAARSRSVSSSELRSWSRTTK